MKLFKKMMALLLAVSMVIGSFGTISAQAAVLEDGGNELIKAAYAESWVEADCNPMNLLDGNASTQWHTLYAGMNPESDINHIPEDANGAESINNSNPMAKYNNLYLVLREPTTVENFYFQARWNASKNFVSNGAPHTFNVYVSDKNYEETKEIEWGEPVAKSPSGGFQYKSTKDLVQYVRFDEAQEGVKTVRIEVTHTYNQNKNVDNKWIRMEEAGINMVLPEEKEYLPLPKEDPLYTIACVSDIHVDYGLEHSATHIRDTITTVMNRVRQEETPNAIVVLGDTISANQKTTGGWYTGTDAEREAVYHQVLDAVYNTLESGMEKPKVMYVAGNHEPEVGMAAFNSQSFIEDGTERTMGEMIAAKSPDDIYANAYFQDNMAGLLTNPEGERNVLAYHYNVDGIDYFGLNPPYVVRASTYAFDWGAMEWVRNKMESIGKDKTFIVLSHYPIGTDLTGGTKDNTNAETTARLKEIFAEFPKTIVLCGHIHTQYIEKDTAEGVVAYAADGVTRYMDTYSTPTGFINMFGGSQGYYGTMPGLVPQGALSAKTPNYNQALMVYFYQDRICFQMKNYGSAGGALTPYTIMREVDLDAAADKKLLNALIDEVEALLKEITEDDVKAKLESAVAEAKAVQSAEDVSQAQVNAAMTALKKAVDENTGKQPEEAASYVDVDDAYETKADELFKIKYLPEGKWTGAANHPEMFINATEHYTAKGTEQFSYEMKFIGTGLEIIATKRDTHANCDVYIDDVYVGDLIAYTSGEKVNQQIVFEIDGLENKEHILKVVKKADDANAMQLDMIRVFYDELKASAISLDAKEVRIGIGGSKQVTANVEPWFVSAEVEWSSADEKVATVDAKGMIKAVAEDYAQTVITAKAKGTDLSAQVTVTVDPDLSKALVTVRDEKLLDIQKDYATLVEAEQVLSFEGTAWKADTINSKIMIAAKDTAVHNAEVTASDFVNEDGDILEAENISIKWLKEVEAYNGKGTKRGELLAYPDIIHKGGAADVAAKTVKFAWVAINVPEDAKAGTYTGTISVTADEMKNPVELTYRVKVINLVQPELEAIDLQFWQHPFSVANYYLGLGSNVAIGSYCNETANDFYFTEKHFNLMRAEVEEYASIGGHDLVATIVEEAWNHQSFYGDPSMIKWTKNADGTWTYDYTWYDKWVEFAIECGVIDPETGLGRIKCYSMVPWNNYVSYYDEATKSTVRRAYTPGNQDWKDLWTPFLTDFMKHSEEKGWFDITYISMDERTMAQLQPTVDLIESITNEDGEHFLISSCLNYAIATDYTFTDHIDDISVGLKHIQANVANSLSEHRRKLGLNTTYYTCTGEYPSNFVISDPGDNYWTMWYTMTMGTDGYLRWAWDNYLYDMHGNISYRSWEPGDCWFFYPLEREEVDMKGDCVAGFYSTPRYEMLKQGIRDVAKAKFLMAQSEEYDKALDEATGSIVRPKSGTVNGSTTYANQTERMLTHSETDRVYAAMSAIAEEFAATIEEPVELEKIEADAMKVTASSVDTTEAGFDKSPEKVLDGDNTTFWASVPDGKLADEWFQVELDQTYMVGQVDYTGRWDAGAKWNCTGNLLGYVIEVSMDGENWTKVAEGEVTDGHAVATFDAVEANFVRVKGTSSYHWQDGTNGQPDNTNTVMTIGDLAVYGAAVPVTVDKTALEAALSAAADLEEELYTEESWTVFAEAKAAAEAVAAKEDATQEEVDAAVEALNAATAALAVKPEPTPTPDPEPVVDPADGSLDVPVEMYDTSAGSTYNSTDYAIDGSDSTHWEVQWDIGATEPEKLWYQIDMGQAVEIQAVRYLPRWDGSTGGQNGFIEGYRIEVSVDGENWTTAAEGTWERTQGWKLAQFDETVEARYVKLIGTKTYADVDSNFGDEAEVNSNMAIAEIRVKAATDKPIIKKDALNKAIEAAEALVAEDYKDMTAVNEALAAAKAMAAKEDATQEEVDAAAAALTSAMEALVKVVKKDALKAAIEDAKAVDQALYTTKTAKSLADAIAAGEDLVADETATQEVVDAAVKGIERAKKALVLRATAEEKAVLEAAVAEAEAIDGTVYTEESAADLAAAIEAAKEVLADADATADDVEDAMEDLEDAIEALEEPTPEPTPGPEVCEVFPDVKHGAWYEVGVQFVYDNGLMSGSEGLFNPTADITRAQIVTTLYRLAGEPEVTDTKALTDFTDVAEGKYYTDAVCWAYANGVATGNDGKFDPTGKLTRQQMAAFFFRFADVMGMDTTVRGDYSSMVNADKVSGYAEEPMAWAVGAGLISGSDVTVNGIAAKDLNPRGNTTRAQVATILMRFCAE